MILPSKHLPPERALLTIGGRILVLLREPLTVSQLWSAFQRYRPDALTITWDMFILAIDLLFILGLVELSGGRLVRREPPR